MIDPLLAGGLLAAAAYCASTLLPFPGIHEALASGALFRTPAPWVALTFDDGPHPERTPRILDALAAAGALATFFVVGRQARRLPELVRRIAREGHTIGNHTDLHAWQPGLSTRKIGQQIDAAQAAVADVTGTLPSLVRPPWGHRDLRFYRESAARGLTPVLWSLDSFDYLGLGPWRLCSRIRRARPGDVVLLHDASPRAAATPDALPLALRSFASACVPLGPVAAR